MKSFRSFLLLSEEQDSHSVFDSIAKDFDTPPVFFTPTVMRRLKYTSEGVIAFHGTNLTGAAGLVKRQNKKNTQLSVVSGKNASSLDQVMAGIETNGGVLLELEGDVSFSFNKDAFTARVNGGRRSVQTVTGISDTGSDFDNAFNGDRGIQSLGDELLFDGIMKAVKVFERPIQKAIQETEANNPRSRMFDTYNRILRGIKENDPKLIFKEERFGNKALSLADIVRMAKDRKSSTKNDDTAIVQRNLLPAAGQFVRQYMDAMEKILNKEEHRSMFVEFSTPLDYGYDEHIMDNFTIKKIHVFKPTLVSSIVRNIDMGAPDVNIHAALEGLGLSSLPGELVTHLMEMIKDKFGDLRDRIKASSPGELNVQREDVVPEVEKVVLNYLKSLGFKKSQINMSFSVTETQTNFVRSIYNEVKTNKKLLYKIISKKTK